MAQAAQTRNVLLANPRGFCAGVVRAIDIVEIALEMYGPPVYVRKEIVHNPHVVDDLREKGAIFVESEDEVPEAGVIVFFGSRGFARGSGPTPTRRRARSSTLRALW